MENWQKCNIMHFLRSRVFAKKGSLSTKTSVPGNSSLMKAEKRKNRKQEIGRGKQLIKHKRPLGTQKKKPWVRYPQITCYLAIMHYSIKI